MHVPRSLLLTPLLALLALTPSIAATPTPQSSNDVIDPIPTPDFSRCIFPQVVDTTIEGPFGLSLLSDTLPLQEWLVFIGSPSEKDVESLYISRRIRIAQPTFNLTDGFLNTPYSGEGSYPGRFVPSTILSPLEQLVFDGQGDPTYFDAMWTCDATGTPYLELRAGARGECFFFFFSSSLVTVVVFYFPQSIRSRFTAKWNGPLHSCLRKKKTRAQRTNLQEKKLAADKFDR